MPGPGGLPPAMSYAAPVDPAAVWPRSQWPARNRATIQAVSVPAADCAPLARSMATVDFLDCSSGVGWLDWVGRQRLSGRNQPAGHDQCRKQGDWLAHRFLDFVEIIGNGEGVADSSRHGRRDPLARALPTSTCSVVLLVVNAPALLVQLVMQNRALAWGNDPVGLEVAF